MLTKVRALSRVCKQKRKRKGEEGRRGERRGEEEEREDEEEEEEEEEDEEDKEEEGSGGRVGGGTLVTRAPKDSLSSSLTAAWALAPDSRPTMASRSSSSRPPSSSPSA